MNNAGGYVMEPEVLAILPPGFCMIERDCFEKLSPQNVIFSCRHNGQWFPTDTLEKYYRAEKEFKPQQDEF